MVTSSTIVAARTQFVQELAKSARLAILEALQEGPLSLIGLSLITGIAQSLIDSDIMWLCENQLVKTKKRGKFIYYYVSDTRVSLLMHLVDQLSIVMTTESSETVNAEPYDAVSDRA